jgi:hypothetical protein
VTSDAATDVEIVAMTESEAAEAFGRLAKREMRISGDEFLRRWDAGEWDDLDLDEVPGLVDVWMALPLVRRGQDDARSNPC